MIRLPGRAEVVRQHLSAMATILRRMDLLASYGTREYALLLPEGA